MARFTHKVSGVRVTVADGKQLGSDWEAEKPKTEPKPKQAGKK